MASYNAEAACAEEIGADAIKALVRRAHVTYK